MTVRCNYCGETWDRDPVLEVACPVCAAGVGQKCRRPSEHAGGFVHPHAKRDRRAMDAVDGYATCSAQPTPTRSTAAVADGGPEPTTTQATLPESTTDRPTDTP